MSLERCREVLPLPELWHKLGLAGEPKRSMHSPFRKDKRASFSVYQESGRWFWKDHAGDEGGSEVDLIMKARGVDVKEAIRIYHELAGVPSGRAQDVPKRARKSAKAQSSSSTAVDSPEAKEAPKRPLRASDYKPDWSPERMGRMVKQYDYFDVDGRLVHQVVRFERWEHGQKLKDFRQRRKPLPDETPADDGWVYAMEGIEPLLYNLAAVAAAPPTAPIFLVEGEKDADTLIDLGLIATTAPMGAGKWRSSYSDALQGKWVVILGDHDEAGRKHVAKACEALAGRAARLGVSELVSWWPSCHGGADVTDWLSALSGSDDLAQAKAVFGLPYDLADSCSPEDVQAAAKAALLWWAEEAQTPAEIRYKACFGIGARGSFNVYHDLLAAVLVQERQVRSFADGWWQWEPHDAQRGRGGVWKQMTVPRDVRRWIGQAIASRSDGQKALNASMVSSIEELMHDRAAIDPNAFNVHDTNLINCANGMLNVRTMELSPHHPDYLSTVQIPWRYLPGSRCEKWETWLAEMLPAEDVRLGVQEIFGYALCSSINLHKFFFFYGEGGTGKSTCVEVLTNLVGEQNTVALRLQELENPLTRALLVGKRLYLCKELERDSLKHIGLVKAITSGDPIPIDKKHKEGFSYRPQGKFIMESNVRAQTSDTSDGFFRRLYQITFENQVPRDQQDFYLLDKFKPEMDGIFWWALQGLKRLLERGRFTDTEQGREAAEQIQMHRASAKAFMMRCTTMTDEDGAELPSSAKVSAEHLFAEYKDWCDWEGVKPYFEDVNGFCRELLNRIPILRDRRSRVQKEGNRFMYYTGLQLLDWRRRDGAEG